MKVQDDDGEIKWVTFDGRLKLMHPTSIQGVENLVSLGDLHEPAIVRNLFIRYKEHLIYVSLMIDSERRGKCWQIVLKVFLVPLSSDDIQELSHR